MELRRIYRFTETYKGNSSGTPRRIPGAASRGNPDGTIREKLDENSAAILCGTPREIPVGIHKGISDGIP